MAWCHHPLRYHRDSSGIPGTSTWKLSCNRSPPCEVLRVKKLSSKEVSNMEAIICVAVHFNSRVPTGLGDVHIQEFVKWRIRYPSGQAKYRIRKYVDVSRMSYNVKVLDLKHSVSQTLSMNQRQIAAVRMSKANWRTVSDSQIESKYGKISSTFSERAFCERILRSVKIVTA